MIDLTPVVTAIGGAKTAAETIKVLLNLKPAPEVASKLSDLYTTILDTQEALLKAREQESNRLDEIKGYKARILELEAWDLERDRYQLQEIPPGVFVYGVRPGHEKGEPNHKLCANCFVKGVKSILHVTHEGHGTITYKCLNCQSDFRTGRFRAPVSQQSSGTGWDG